MAEGRSGTLRDVEWIVGLVDERTPPPDRPPAYRRRISN